MLQKVTKLQLVAFTIAFVVSQTLNGEIRLEFPEIAGTEILLNQIDRMAESERGIPWEVQNLDYHKSSYESEML